MAFLAEHDPRRSYRVYRDEFAFRDVVLPGLSLRRGARWVMVSRGLLRLMRRFRPDVVIVGGWNQPAFWEALAAARVRAAGASVGREQRVRRPGRRRRRRRGAAGSRFALAQASSSPAGRRARTCAGSASPASGSSTRRTRSTSRVFAERVEAERADRAALRGRLGLDGCVFLYVGRFEPEKGLDVLLRAMRDVPATLVLVGSGPLEAELRRRGRAVRVVGQLTRDELVPWYAAADALRPAVAVGAVGDGAERGGCGGLPLVATEAVGAAHDLIEPGVQRLSRAGGGSRPRSARRCARSLPTRRSAVAPASARESWPSGFSPERWAAAVVSAARSAGRRSAG